MPGGYYDCAIWRADDLTIEGIGNDVRLTDTTCEGKAIFITAGNRITIRNLTFARARVPIGTARAFARKARTCALKTAASSTMKAGSSPPVRRTVKLPYVTANSPPTAPAGLATAPMRSRSGNRPPDGCQLPHLGTKGGDAIYSLAAHTELIDNHIEDGANGAAAYLVELPAGGSLEMDNNVLERGPLPSDPSVAVRVMEGRRRATVQTLAFSGNTLRNDTHAPLTFVLNWTGTTARMENNHLPQDVTPVSSSGYLWFLTKSSIHRSLAAAEALARAIRHHL